MGWVRVDDSFYDQRTFWDLDLEQIGAWITLLAWSSRNGTDGRVLDDVLRRTVGKHADCIGEALELAGLLDRNYYGAGVHRLCDFKDFTTPQSRPAIPKSLRDAVLERDGRQCLQCGTVENLTLDHVIPFSLGGEDTFENLQTLCRSCNSRKGVRVS